MHHPSQQVFLPSAERLLMQPTPPSSSPDRILHKVSKKKSAQKIEGRRGIKWINGALRVRASVRGNTPSPPSSKPPLFHVPLSSSFPPFKIRVLPIAQRLSSSF